MNDDTLAAIAVLDALSGMIGEFHFCVNKNKDGTYSPYYHLCTGNNPREMLDTVCDDRKTPRVTVRGCYDDKAYHHRIPVHSLYPFVGIGWPHGGDIGCRFSGGEALNSYGTVEDLIAAEGLEPWWWGGCEREVYLGGQWPFKD